MSQPDDQLKIGDFKPEPKGQLEFYLDTRDQQHRLEGENPPIGIVICRRKTKTMVEYALRTMMRPLGIARYTVTPQLNAEDGGSRQFILVQIPQPIDPKGKKQKEAHRFVTETLGKLDATIFEITAERLRRAGAKIEAEQAAKAQAAAMQPPPA